MSGKFKTIFPGIADGFYNMTGILPLIISMCVCSAFSMKASLTSALICSFAFPFTGLIPSYSLFVILYSISAFYGLNTALAGTLLCAVLLFAVSFFKTDKLKQALYTPVIAAGMLGFTLYMTVMQTTNYFGISAVGRNAVEMIKSYRSLGFHGNWRGVLYGTIVLVIMIVYRRKFKNLSKRIPAAFWCFVITIPLNMALIPGNIVTPISEIGSYSYYPECISLLNVNVFGTIICGFSLLFIYLYRFTVDKIPTGKKAIMLNGAFMSIISLSGSVAPYPSEKPEKRLSEKITASVTCVIICSIIIILLNRFIGRTPVPTCAVILIIGMWQQNIWRYLKSAFTSGITGILAFLTVISIILLINPETGVIISAFICAAYKMINKNKNKKQVNI